MLIERYNKARCQIEYLFKGLPPEPSSLIKSLMTIADPLTGLVTGLTWHDVSLLIEVAKRPGRKNSGIPSKDQTREYINTILKQCGDEFEMATEGQKLQFRFVSMPAIYAQFFSDKKEFPTPLPTESHTAEPLEKTGSIEDFDALFDREFPTEDPTAEMPVKNNNILNINKHNKQTPVKEKIFKPIADDFYPDEKTIAKAQGLGFLKVTDKQEIRKFIQKNRRWRRLHPDFNPVFLKWLRQDFYPDSLNEPTPSPTQPKPRNHNERSSHQSCHQQKPTLAGLRARNLEIINDVEGDASGFVIEGTCSEAVSCFG